MKTVCEANILLVEDNPDHAEVALKALRKGETAAKVFWVKDGQEAVDFLEQRLDRREAETAPCPGLILLDINLPKLNGHEVLRRIKSDPLLRTIPVIMFSTSDHADDVTASYHAGANSYVTKPISFEELVDRVGTMKMYWTRTNKLPS